MCYARMPLWWAGVVSWLAALLHLACIAIGPAAYRLLGAGEQMSQMAERGQGFPIAVTLGIALILTVWALYAWSGVGVIRRLPLLRPMLLLITSVLLARGILAPVLVHVVDHPYLRELQARPIFMGATSCICLLYAALFGWGWHQMAHRQ